MTETVSIPADKARDLAQYHRDRSNAGPHVVSHDAARWHRETADLLDPPPTLRQRAIRAIYSAESRKPGATVSEVHADAVLAVVAEAPIEWVLATFGPRLSDWLEAQPRTPLSAIDLRHAERNQRDHDVRLLRGGSDG